jgi:hypothetical protein
VKKGQNGRKSLRRLKPTVGCNARRRRRRRRGRRRRRRRKRRRRGRRRRRRRRGGGGGGGGGARKLYTAGAEVGNTVLNRGVRYILKRLSDPSHFCMHML